MEYHLAQINIGRVLGEMDDPIMYGFVSQLDAINALADSSPGFVWRLQSEDGDATSIRPFDDPKTLLNMSVWESLEALSNFVYRSAHRSVMRRRKEWFERFDGPYIALWWIEAGHIPTVDEGMRAVESVRTNGPTLAAFSFARPFPPPGSDVAPAPSYEECA